MNMLPAVLTAAVATLGGFSIAFIHTDNSENFKTEKMKDEEPNLVIFSTIMGSLISGVIVNDYLGLTKTMQINDLIIFFSIITKNRSIAAIAIAVANSSTTLYLSEASPPKIRGGMICLYSISITLGKFFLYVMKGTKAFDSLGLGLLLITLMAHLVVLGFSPKSGPKWGAGQEGFPLRAFCKDMWSSSKLRKALMVGVLVHIMSQIVGSSYVNYLNGMWLETAKISRKDQFKITIVFTLMGFILETVSVDRLGARKIMLFGLSSLAPVLVYMATLFKVENGKKEDHMPQILFGIYNLIYNGSISLSAEILNTNLYPTNIRSTACSVAALGNHLVSWIFTQNLLLTSENEPSYNLLFYSVASMTAFVIIKEFVPSRTAWETDQQQWNWKNILKRAWKFSNISVCRKGHNWEDIKNVVIIV